LTFLELWVNKHFIKFKHFLKIGKLKEIFTILFGYKIFLIKFIPFIIFRHYLKKKIKIKLKDYYKAEYIFLKNLLKL